VSIRYLFRSWFVGLFSYETADNSAFVCTHDGADEHPNISADVFTNLSSDEVTVSGSISSFHDSN
jgi:hypothetical protein